MRTVIKQCTPFVSVLFLCSCLIFLPLLAQATESAAGDWKMTQGKAGADDTRGEPPAPRISPSGGTYFTEQTVTIHCRVPDATVRFTTDGSIPDQSDDEYEGPLHVAENTTVKARAFLDGWPPGEVATSAYELKVTTPELAPPGGYWDHPINVTITADTPGSNIRYTEDGSTPTASYGSIYVGAISVDTYTTIKAVAYKPGWTSSDVASATYDASDIPQVKRGHAGGASIRLEIPHSGHVRAQVFDVRGKLAATPYDGYHSAGNFSYRWDHGSTGEPVPPGVYFMRVDLDGEIVGTTKVLVVR